MAIHEFTNDGLKLQSHTQCTGVSELISSALIVFIQWNSHFLSHLKVQTVTPQILSISAQKH